MAAGGAALLWACCNQPQMRLGRSTQHRPTPASQARHHIPPSTHPQSRGTPPRTGAPRCHGAAPSAAAPSAGEWHRLRGGAGGARSESGGARAKGVEKLPRKTEPQPLQPRQRRTAPLSPLHRVPHLLEGEVDVQVSAGGYNVELGGVDVDALHREGCGCGSSHGEGLLGWQAGAEGQAARAPSCATTAAVCLPPCCTPPTPTTTSPSTPPTSTTRYSWGMVKDL